MCVLWSAFALFVASNCRPPHSVNTDHISPSGIYLQHTPTWLIAPPRPSCRHRLRSLRCPRCPHHPTRRSFVRPLRFSCTCTTNDAFLTRPPLCAPSAPVPEFDPSYTPTTPGHRVQAMSYSSVPPPGYRPANGQPTHVVRHTSQAPRHHPYRDSPTSRGPTDPPDTVHDPAYAHYDERAPPPGPYEHYK